MSHVAGAEERHLPVGERGSGLVWAVIQATFCLGCAGGVQVFGYIYVRLYVVSLMFPDWVNLLAEFGSFLPGWTSKVASDIIAAYPEAQRTAHASGAPGEVEWCRWEDQGGWRIHGLPGALWRPLRSMKYI